MASVHLAYYFFLLTFCIDKGDSRWKKTERENLRHDIKLYKKITERIEHEIQEYYAEYEDHRLRNFKVNRNYYETNRNMPKSAKLDNEDDQMKKSDRFLSKFSKITNFRPTFNESITNDSIKSNEISKSINLIKTTNQKSKWPKFEDMLLAIGKKYDWKNDRWIKMKQKFKTKDKDYDDVNNRITLHEKHRFSYRTIKLNRGKNKRNVVIAVTAIR